MDRSRLIEMVMTGTIMSGITKPRSEHVGRFDAEPQCCALGGACDVPHNASRKTQKVMQNDAF